MNRSKAFAISCLVGCFLIPSAFRAAVQEPKPETQPEPKTEAPAIPKVPEEMSIEPAHKAMQALQAVRKAEREANEAKVEAEIDKLLNEFDVSPKPLFEIPDDPPPHEGAMIDMPEYRIEPPDLILIELLEALPGRPITGERLVRPDGSISLGFYGEVHVRGLTVKQAKVKILKHLRRVLTDQVLGLYEEFPIEADPLQPQLVPGPPGGVEGPFKPPTKPKGISTPKSALPVRVKVHSVSGHGRVHPTVRQATRNAARVSLARGLESSESQAPPQDEPEVVVENPEKAIKVPLKGDGAISIHIEIKGGNQQAEPENAAAGVPENEEWGRAALPPDESDRLFIDVSAYNSKSYFVLGDVAAPGKIPITGNETVLDALQYAGGFLNTADQKKVHLVRPGRNGKPGKVYKVDLEAIETRGETATNYQIFAGDRLIIGRDDIVKKTSQLDRLASPIQSVMQSILQESFTARSAKLAAPDQPEVLMKNLVEFWIHEMNRPEGAVFNEETLREALLRCLPIKPDAVKPAK